MPQFNLGVGVLTYKWSAFHAVVVIQAVPETGVAGLWPVVLIEAGGILEHVFADVEGEFLRRLVYRKRFKWYGEILIAEAQEAAEGQYGIIYGTGVGVNHEILNFTELFAFIVSDVGSGDTG